MLPLIPQTSPCTLILSKILIISYYHIKLVSVKHSLFMLFLHFNVNNHFTIRLKILLALHDDCCVGMRVCCTVQTVWFIALHVLPLAGMTAVQWAVASVTPSITSAPMTWTPHPQSAHTPTSLSLPGRTLRWVTSSCINQRRWSLIRGHSGIHGAKMSPS